MSDQHSLSAKVWQEPAYFISFGFGTGLMPTAPGTWGTLAAIPIYLLLAHCSFAVYLVLVLLMLAIGVWLVGKVSNDLGVHDHPGIVWDEVIGYLLTMATAPVGLGWMVCGFLLFRLFDIWKPWPISYVDQEIKGSFGIMLDDIMAAIPAWFILQLLVWMFA
ncbi:phosphatidylglycerophosphatase A [Legionella dresdenensis]|uniref:Phosphatidylglycerophosphatase A n=1 Tax=Legionella dresdenensis TaxID=450200 RepID=A0ABV8CEH1_9GAMM